MDRDAFAVLIVGGIVASFFIAFAFHLPSHQLDWTDAELQLKSYCDLRKGIMRHDGFHWDACLLPSGVIVDERDFAGFRIN